MSKSPKLLFLLSGSIAAFKAAQALSQLVQAGYDVQVVATEQALKFIGAPTLEGLSGKKVLSDLWEPGQAMDHISLARSADAAVLCPASANTLAKIAHGFADDLVSTLTLAWSMKKPYLVFPAMNSQMLRSEAVQANLLALKTRQFVLAPTASGLLACGEEGEGRLLEPEAILQFIEKTLARGNVEKEAFGRILVTAGATREPIDGIRFISNVSTGQTGASLADALSNLGWKVTYLHGQGAQLPAKAAFKVAFNDYADLERKLKSEVEQRDYAAVIHSAAVSDFSVEKASPEIKMKSGSPLTLHLRPNGKILPRLKTLARDQRMRVIGFKLTLNATAEDTLTQARNILTSTVDAVVANDWSKVNSDRTRHPGWVVTASGEQTFQNISELADQLHQLVRNP